jgi:hypothetical protein
VIQVYLPDGRRWEDASPEERHAEQMRLTKGFYEMVAIPEGIERARAELRAKNEGRETK